jgi:hypothetical protein
VNHLSGKVRVDNSYSERAGRFTFGGLKHVPPREKETPDDDPFRVNLWLQLQPCDGVAVVGVASENGQ